jgi:hypothetical protein
LEVTGATRVESWKRRVERKLKNKRGLKGGFGFGVQQLAFRSRFVHFYSGAYGKERPLTRDSLKFHLGPPCLTLLHPVGRPPLEKPCGRFRGGPQAGSLRPSSTPSRPLAIRYASTGESHDQADHNDK